MKIGKLEIDLEELARFIAKAKKNCYAGDCDHTLLSDGSKQLTFQEGDFFYEDNYSGFYQAPGRELVKWQKSDGQRIWQMSYSGGMLPEFFGNEKLARETFEFLKKALSQVDSKLPFRGPCILQERDVDENAWTYSTGTNGDLQRFTGYEYISNLREDTMVFKQDYVGGLVIPK